MITTNFLNRIKYIIIVLFCFLSTFSVTAQQYNIDTIIYRQDAGIIDAQGKKQGYWIYYRDIIKKGVNGKRTEFLNEGYYKDDKKVGLWTYYVDMGENYCWESLVYPSYYICYFDDGSLLYENVKHNQRIKFNSDSIWIEGEILRNLSNYLTSLSTKVFIVSESFNSKVICKFITETGKEIVAFDPKELEYHLEVLNTYGYDRIIRKLL